MAKIKVQGYGSGPYNRRVGGDVSFSLVSSPKEGRKQVMDFMTCKAYVHDAVTAHVLRKGDYGGHYRKGKNPTIDMEKLRLLVGTNSEDIKEYKKKLFAAKRMLNLLEKAAGWQLSKISAIEHSQVEKGVWLITGPKQWMQSPQMISMVTLVIRAAVRNGPVDPKNEKEATALFKKWSIKNVYGDSSYMHASWDKLFLIAKNYDQLFDGLTAEQRYEYGSIGSHSNGIANWCSGQSGSSELNKRLKALCKEHKVAVRKDYY